MRVLTNRVAVTKASTSSMKKRMKYSGRFLLTRRTSRVMQAWKICHCVRA